MKIMNLYINIPKKYLLFRKDAKEILAEVLANKEIVRNVYLDFSKAAFFSRSFTDEFLNVIGDLSDRGVSVIIHNLNPKLKRMIDRIRTTKAEIQKAFS